MFSSLIPNDPRPRPWHSGYDVIADEYYEPRHSTSRNFDAATRAYFHDRPLSLPNDGLALDVGAGRGRLSEYCGVAPTRIVQLDLAAGMLILPDREPALGRVQANALALPFEASVFSIVAAFLFDPFNQRSFFEQVARVMDQGGIFVGTMPHYVWGITFRSRKGTPLDEAVFALKSGEHISQPSFLSPQNELINQLTSAGMKIIKSEALTLPQDVTHISPDIELAAAAMLEAVHRIPIVQLVIATRA